MGNGKGVINLIRRKMSRRGSNKNFRRGRKTNKRNFSTAKRGGYRL